MRVSEVGVVSILVLGGLLLGGCSNSSDDAQQAVLTTDVPEEVISVSILIQDEDGVVLPNVAVTIDDNETDLLAKLTNLPVAAKGYYAKTEELISDELGYVNFELQAGTIEGDLTITVNNEGYFPVSKIYSIDGEDQLDTLTLTSKPAAGESDAVTVVTESGEEEEVVTIVAEQEFVEETVEIVTIVDDQPVSVSVQGQVSRIESVNEETDDGEKEVVAEVLIPVAVEAETVDGVAAQGDIVVTAAVYQNDSEASVEVFPGGLEVGDDVENLSDAPVLITDDAATEDEEATFVSAGFISLEVTDEAGNDITEFSGSTGVDIDGDGVEEQGLLVASLIPKSTINPATGEPVALGELIPVWSYDDQTAKWEYDGQAKIFESADDDNWRARFAATHLSYWNLDWRYGMCAGYTTDDTAPIEFLSALTGERDTRSLTVKTARVGNGYYKTRTVYGDGYVKGRIADDNVVLTVIDRQTGESIEILSINDTPYTGEGFNFCDLVGQGGNDVMLDEAPVDLTDMTVIVQTSCSDSALDELQPPEPIPSSRIYVYNSLGNYMSSATTDSTGAASITGVSVDAEFSFRIRNRLYPDAGDGYYVRTGLMPVTDAQPLLVDIEQECVVTTGSVGGS